MKLPVLPLCEVFIKAMQEELEHLLAIQRGRSPIPDGRGKHWANGRSRRLEDQLIRLRRVYFIAQRELHERHKDQKRARRRVKKEERRESCP